MSASICVRLTTGYSAPTLIVVVDRLPGSLVLIADAAVVFVLLELSALAPSNVYVRYYLPLFTKLQLAQFSTEKHEKAKVHLRNEIFVQLHQNSIK